MRFVCLLAAAGLLLPSAVPARAHGPRLIEVPVSSVAERAQIARWGVEVVDAQPDRVTLAVPVGKKVTPKVDRALSRMPGVKILAEDADELFREFADKPDAGAYHTYDEAKAELTDLATRFPAIATLHDLGKSHEGRETVALRITGGEASKWGKPVFLFMGCHHAREWISVEVPLAIAKHLVEGYAIDPAIKNLVDTREVWCVPVVNPDGLNYSQSNYKYWRKNRKPNGDGSFGVDPNRNYGYKWGTAGDSGDPDSDVYRGPEAFSEVDTQHIRDFASQRVLTTSISYHSYGERVMFPYSYDYVTAPDDAQFRTHANGMAALNGYRPHQSVEMYPSSGDTDDHLYAEQGSLSYTIELARTFIPQESQIPQITEPNVKAVRYLIENAAEPFPFVKHTPPSAVAGTLAINATFDAAHHPNFRPAEMVCVVKTGDTVQELPMAATADNPDVFAVEVPGATAGQPVEYFFGLKTADGRVARAPRLSNFSVTPSEGGPRALLTGF